MDLRATSPILRFADAAGGQYSTGWKPSPLLNLLFLTSKKPLQQRDVGPTFILQGYSVLEAERTGLLRTGFCLKPLRNHLPQSREGVETVGPGHLQGRKGQLFYFMWLAPSKLAFEQRRLSHAGSKSQFLPYSDEMVECWN